MILIKKSIVFLFFLTFFSAGEVNSQESQDKEKKEKKVNFSYSANPPARTIDGSIKTPKPDEVNGNRKPTPESSLNAKAAAKLINIAKSEPQAENVVSSVPVQENSSQIGSRITQRPETTAQAITIAKKTREIAKNSALNNLSPAEYYKTGVGDILFISLKNGSAATSKYYTVLNDGTIDYPLVGGMISVEGLSTDQIEDMLRGRIKIYENPDISVAVREYASHRIVVTGMVEKTGEMFLQREAMPLFAIRAMVMVDAKADRVTVKRKNTDLLSINLMDSEKQASLIFPGDILEFGAEETPEVTGYFYIGAFVKNSGKHSLTGEMTLTQAVIAAGGLVESKLKKVVIRRKNDSGLLKSAVFKLNDIRDGKTPDPVLLDGDIVESDR